MEWHKDEFTISTDNKRVDYVYVHTFLSKQSYWARNIPSETVKRSLDNSLCFGIYDGAAQIGFARVISDLATFAYLADVFVDKAYRGRGPSKWLMEVILAHPDLQGLRRIMLATRDAHALYAKYGFEPVAEPGRLMQIIYPDRYGALG